MQAQRRDIKHTGGPRFSYILNHTLENLMEILTLLFPGVDSRVCLYTEGALTGSRFMLCSTVTFSFIYFISAPTCLPCPAQIQV